MARTVLDEFITIFRFEVAGAGKVRAELSSIEMQVNRTVTAMGRGVLMWGAAFGFAAVAVSKAEDQIFAIATQARISTDVMKEFNRELIKTGEASGTTASQMRDAIQEFVERTGDVGMIMRQRGIVAEMIRGLRMKPEDVGNLLGGFRDIGIDEKEWRNVVNRMADIAKKGSLPIEKLADIMPRGMAAGLMSGTHDPVEMTAQMTAFFQIVNRMTRASRKSMTAVENFIMDYSNGAHKISEATGMVFTGREGITGVIKKLSEFYESGGDASKLSGVFGEPMKDAKEVRNIFQELGGSFGRRGQRAATAAMLWADEMERLADSSKEAGDVMKNDTEARANTVRTSINSLVNSLEKLIAKLVEDGGLVVVVQTFGDVLAGLVAVISKIPQPILTVIMLSILWQKVIIGMIATAFKPLYMFIGVKLVSALGAYEVATIGALVKTAGLSTAFKVLWGVIMKNPWIFLITALLHLLLLIPVVKRGLDSLFGKGNKVMAEISATGMPTVASSLLPIQSRSAGQVNVNNSVHVENLADQESVDMVSENMQAMISNAGDYLYSV